jgi:hypothetical protein
MDIEKVKEDMKVLNADELEEVVEILNQVLEENNVCTRLEFVKQ